MGDFEKCGIFMRSVETSRARRPEVDGYHEAWKKIRWLARTRLEPTPNYGYCP